jgi:hypothetical protein
MSEDTEDTIPEVEFVRFKHPYEDLAGFVIIRGNKIIIDFPLIVELESDYEEGRQALFLKEFLPQGIISKTTIEFPLKDILFHEPVREDFLEHYEEAKEFFFFEQLNAERKITLKKKGGFNEEASPFDEETTERVKNVVSILEALRDKKDKPVH